MQKFLFFVCLMTLPLASPVFGKETIAEGSQPWGGMVSDRVKESKAQRSSEARRILDAARRLEARYAGMEFEETPDERELREYLQDMAKRSLGAKPPEAFGTKKSKKSEEIVEKKEPRRFKPRRGFTYKDEEPVKPDFSNDSDEEMDERQKEYAKQRQTEEEVANLLEKRKIGGRDLPVDPTKKSVTTTTADKGLDLKNNKNIKVLAGKKLDTTAEPMPEVDIIENGVVSDAEWMSKNQREVEEVIQTRRENTPFEIKKSDKVEIFIYPCSADGMQFWKDLRVNRATRKLLAEGKIIVYVPHETFEDSGPAIAYAWLKDKEPAKSLAFLDFVADLPQKSLIPGGDMPKRLYTWMQEIGHPLDSISSASREERAKTVAEIRKSNDRLRELKGHFGKFPQIYVNGKASPNYFSAVETQK